MVYLSLGGTMKQVIMEYAGAAIAMLGSFFFFSFIGGILLGKNGLLAELIQRVLGGL